MENASLGKSLARRSETGKDPVRAQFVVGHRERPLFYE